MPIPAEFERYREPRKSEENFIQKLLKPLLQRLGYYSVRDYHGSREFGKDLVFAEVDRFAEISYHGLQAKYEDSVSLTMAGRWTPFKHLQTRSSIHQHTSLIGSRHLLW